MEQAAIGFLHRVGLRDQVRDGMIARRRVARLRAEAAGSDRLSRPALHGMDTALDELIGKDNGFFVEAGANDGFTQSNTHLPGALSGLDRPSGGADAGAL